MAVALGLEVCRWSVYLQSSGSDWHTHNIMSHSGDLPEVKRRRVEVECDAASVLRIQSWWRGTDARRHRPRLANDRQVGPSTAVVETCPVDDSPACPVCLSSEAELEGRSTCEFVCTHSTCFACFQALVRHTKTKRALVRCPMCRSRLGRSDVLLCVHA